MDYKQHEWYRVPIGLYAIIKLKLKSILKPLCKNHLDYQLVERKNL